MSIPHTPRLEELLPAYALGALDGDELREMEEHLAGGCEECRRQLPLWQGDLEELAATVTPVQPSEITRARVLRLAGGAAAVPPAATPVAARRSPGVGWLAAAALVLLGLSVWGLAGQARLSGEVRRLAADRDGQAREVERLSQEVVAARGQAVKAEQALQVLAAPGVQSVVLAGLAAAPGAKGHAYVNPSTRDALFYAFDLPALPRDKTYELWFIAAGKPVAAGTFAVDPRGSASLRVDRVAAVGTIDAWAVTVEPSGGVPQPTGAMVLKG
ncbi:MAG TPA: anti-sigma factor [Thermoanaerobaculia bacterium]|jgi:anti-sigma-K factor RskA